jgi:hypothetical protein
MKKKIVKIYNDIIKIGLGVCRTFNNSESKKMGFSEPIIGF